MAYPIRTGCDGSAAQVGEHEGRTAADRRHEPSAARGDAARQAIRMRLDELEDRLYELIDYLESRGEDEILAYAGDVRSGLESRAVSPADVLLLSGSVHALNRCADRLEETMRQLLAATTPPEAD